jgi:hypothetical protein
VKLENIDGQRMHDLDMAKKVSSISKIVMASSAEVWLIHCPGPAFNHFYSNDMEGLNICQSQEVFYTSYQDIREEALM